MSNGDELRYEYHRIYFSREFYFFCGSFSGKLLYTHIKKLMRLCIKIFQFQKDFNFLKDLNYSAINSEHLSKP